jgi:hypothetical protein
MYVMARIEKSKVIAKLKTEKTWIDQQRQFGKEVVKTAKGI